MFPSTLGESRHARAGPHQFLQGLEVSGRYLSLTGTMFTIPEDIPAVLSAFREALSLALEQ